MRSIAMLCVVVVMKCLVGCGGGLSTPSGVTTATGKFVDAPVEGLKFMSGSQNGFTGPNGEFTYEIGKSVVFSVGGVVIGKAQGANIITPIELVSDANPGVNVNVNTSTVVQIVQFLLTASTLTSTGIKIDSAVTAACSLKNINISRASSSDFASMMNEVVTVVGNRSITSATDAQAHFAASMSGLTSGSVILPPASITGGSFNSGPISAPISAPILTPAPPPVVTWKIVELGSLPVDDYQVAYGVNDYGIVVGLSGMVNSYAAGFYLESGKIMPALGILKSINNQGVAAGVHFSDNYGFIRQKDGTYTFLTPPQNWSQSALNCINNVGHAVGTGWLNSPINGHRGFIYDGTNFKPIQPLAGDSETWAIAINDSDSVTGYSTSNPNKPVARGFIQIGGNIEQIGFLPGATDSYPVAINNDGVVVGISGGQAFRYSNGTIQALGFLPGDNYSVANGINDNGDIVGRSGTKAFLYKNGVMIDLSSLQDVTRARWSSLLEARAINNLGQIVGEGYHNGSLKLYLLTPSQ